MSTNTVKYTMTSSWQAVTTGSQHVRLVNQGSGSVIIAVATVSGDIVDYETLAAYREVSMVLPLGGSLFAKLAASATSATVLVHHDKPAPLTTDLSASVVTSTSVSATFTPAEPFAWSQHYINVTAVSGTSPTLDIVLQESIDGVEWRDRWHFERVTAVTSTQLRTPYLPHRGLHYRYSFTVGGTTPSFTLTTRRICDPSAIDGERYQFFDRTINPNSLGSVTPWYDVSGCDTISFGVNVSTLGTAANFGLVVSPDQVGVCSIQSTTPSGVGYALVGSPATTPRNVRWARIQVLTAGTGMVLHTTNPPSITVHAWKA